ncbi:MAG TPA: FHA domain-containing protein, partial [Oceanospirillales bacterium]|nr:FHA domain-containing protein [Oceanospirillales bacterium]
MINMKLVFPHKEHKDFELIGDSFTIGSSDDAVIQIKEAGMSDIHATLLKDGDEFSLKIENPACMASVNGRLVKDSREVRVGDLMIIAQVHCKVESDAAAKIDDNKTRIRMALPKYVLRGVSGVYFGKTFPLRGKTSLGRHSENDIFVNVDGISRKHAVISVLADGLEIEDLDSSNGTFVNGKKIIKQKLEIGDEVKFDNIRFLIQSPG